MKSLNGKVISDKMQQTAVVAVSRYVVHPMYHKRFIRTQRYHVHNEIGAKTGDQVKIVECKPYSKTVTFKVSQIIKKYAAA